VQPSFEPSFQLSSQPSLQRLGRSIQRYAQAFLGALRLTLRGETPPPAPYPELRAWIEGGLQRLNTLTQAVEAAGLTADKRQAMTFIADGRRVTMETVLTGLRYHLAEEYPYLLRDITEHSRLAIYSTNVNDTYRLTKLMQTLQESTNQSPQDLTAILESVEELRNHLNTFPESADNSGKDVSS
jgi:hypothetical protein